MKKKWTYENTYNEAKKYEYQRDFRINSSGAYDAARHNGWMPLFDWLKKGSGTNRPIDIYAYEDRENKVVYVGLTVDMQNRHYRHKNGEIKNGVRRFDVVYKYFHSIGKDVPKPIIRMSDLETDEDGQYYEDWYKLAYKNEGWKVLNIGKTGIGSSSIGGNRRIWTKEAIKKVAKTCVSRHDLEKKYSGACAAAREMGIMDELFPEKVNKDSGYWKIFENHLKEIDGCKSIADYDKKNHSACNAAREYGFIDRLFPNKLHKPITKEELQEAKKYKDRNELSHNNRRLYLALYKRGLLDEFYS